MSRTHVDSRVERGCLPVLVASTTTSRAEEVEKKFRLAFSLGGYDTSDQVHSASANRRTLFEPNGEIDDQIYDPRNDSAALSDFGIEPAARRRALGVVRVQPPVVRRRLGRLSARDRRKRRGPGSVPGRADPPTVQDFKFTVFNLDGGTLTQIPLQVTAGIRFRPKAAFNPYSASESATRSIPTSRATRSISCRAISISPHGTFARLSGTRSGEGVARSVRCRRESEWNHGRRPGRAGVALRRWIRVLVQEPVGRLPRRTVLHLQRQVRDDRERQRTNSASRFPPIGRFNTDPDAFGPFGAVSASARGGLVDGGSYVPTVTAPEGTDCTGHRHIQL